MAQEQLNPAKPLVPSHLYVVVEAVLEAEPPSAVCSPASCPQLLKGDVGHAGWFAERLALMSNSVSNAEDSNLE